MHVEVFVLRDRLDAFEQGIVRTERVAQQFCQLLHRLSVADRFADDWIENQAVEDRKSTRLNSSHDQISYAVFCLKKKKIQYRTDRKTTCQQPRHDTILNTLSSLDSNNKR